MSDRGNFICPVCGTSLHAPPSPRGRTADLAYYDCPHCGVFGLTRPAEVNLRSWMEETGDRERKAAIFAHALRKMQQGQESPLLGPQVAGRIMETSDLPTVQEQADHLIRLLGASFPPGEFGNVSFLEHGAIVGVLSPAGFFFLVKGLIDARILQGSLTGGEHAAVQLTFQGWQRFEELRLGAPSGRNAFMAMQYGLEQMDRIVNEHFRPAVADTGFVLKRLDDEPRAGLIDDRLRVEIQGARFLVADLTHGNPGAYWEAGYAEGLGKPVIYTCERQVFEDKGSHFDTSHHLHVLWEEGNMGDAVERLKATIRATIPEARRGQN